MAGVTAHTEVVVPEVKVEESVNGNGNGHGHEHEHEHDHNRGSPPSPSTSRPRVFSTPASPMAQRWPGTPSPGPSQMRFPSINTNSLSSGLPASPIRQSFGPASHSRTRSISAQNPSRLPPSPLSTSFSPRFEDNTNLTSNANLNANANANSEADKQSARRHHHARIHSRNLSVFFPRPGAIPTPIAEDGGQEVEYDDRNPAPVTLIPPMNNNPAQKRLGEGFTFGGRPNGVSSDGTTTMSGTASRRGHHHKHSVSHNFFSFLEPPDELQRGSSPGAESDRGPVTPFSAPSMASVSSSGSQASVLHADVPSAPIGALVVSVAQFMLGAAIWVQGQQVGSLGCTGLGYWVVFDAFGVGLEHLLPAYLSPSNMRSQTRRAFG